MNKKVLISFLLVGLILTFVGCAQASNLPGTNNGTANAAGNTSVVESQAASETEAPQIPDEEGPKITRISDIFAQPGSYKGKDVIVEGKIVAECPSGCWFTLSDGTGNIYVDLNPSNLVIPQKRGAAAKVYGKVVIERGDAYIIGTKVEF